MQPSDWIAMIAIGPTILVAWRSGAVTAARSTVDRSSARPDLISSTDPPDADRSDTTAWWPPRTADWPRRGPQPVAGHLDRERPQPVHHRRQHPTQRNQGRDSWAACRCDSRPGSRPADTFVDDPDRTAAVHVLASAGVHRCCRYARIGDSIELHDRGRAPLMLPSLLPPRPLTIGYATLDPAVRSSSGSGHFESRNHQSARASDICSESTSRWTSASPTLAVPGSLSMLSVVPSR